MFYTVLGEGSDLDGTAAALASAKGLIQSEVGKQLGMRHVPTLEFIHDALPETARQIDDLLERVRSPMPLRRSRRAARRTPGSRTPTRSLAPRTTTSLGWTTSAL